MKIFGLNITRSKNNTSKKAPLLYSDWEGSSWSYTPTMSVGELLSNNTVASCVQLISDYIAMTSLDVYKRDADGSRDLATDSPLYYLLRKKPNPHSRHFDFIQTMVSHLLLRGNVFIYIQRQTGWNPIVTGLYLMDPDEITIQRDSQTNEITYAYDSIKGRTVFKEWEVLHIPAYRYDKLRGMSPLENATHNARLGIKLDEYTDNWFSDGVHSKLLINVPAEQRNWTKEQSKALSDQIVSAYGGPNNAHKPMIMSKGLEAKGLDTAGNDVAQLSENRDFSERQIAQIFRVPMYMLGKGDSKFSSAETMNRFFLSAALTPWMERIKEAFDTLLPDYQDNYYVDFNTETLLRADIKSRMDVYTKGITYGIFSPDECRRKENIPALPDGAGSKPFIAVNMMQLTKNNLDAYMAQQKAALSKEANNAKEEK